MSVCSLDGLCGNAQSCNTCTLTIPEAVLQWKEVAEMPAYLGHHLLSKSTEIIKPRALRHLLIICIDEASPTPGKSVPLPDVQDLEA